MMLLAVGSWNLATAAAPRAVTRPRPPRSFPPDASPSPCLLVCSGVLNASRGSIDSFFFFFISKKKSCFFLLIPSPSLHTTLFFYFLPSLFPSRGIQLCVGDTRTFKGNTFLSFSDFSFCCLTWFFLISTHSFWSENSMHVAFGSFFVFSRAGCVEPFREEFFRNFQYRPRIFSKTTFRLLRVPAQIFIAVENKFHFELLDWACFKFVSLSMFFFYAKKNKTRFMLFDFLARHSGENLSKVTLRGVCLKFKTTFKRFWSNLKTRELLVFTYLWDTRNK